MSFEWNTPKYDIPGSGQMQCFHSHGAGLSTSAPQSKQPDWQSQGKRSFPSWICPWCTFALANDKAPSLPFLFVAAPLTYTSLPKAKLPFENTCKICIRLPDLGYQLLYCLRQCLCGELRLLVPAALKIKWLCQRNAQSLIQEDPPPCPKHPFGEAWTWLKKKKKVNLSILYLPFKARSNWDLMRKKTLSSFFSEMSSWARIAVWRAWGKQPHLKEGKRAHAGGLNSLLGIFLKNKQTWMQNRGICGDMWSACFQEGPRWWHMTIPHHKSGARSTKAQRGFWVSMKKEVIFSLENLLFKWNVCFIKLRCWDMFSGN